MRMVSKWLVGLLMGAAMAGGAVAGVVLVGNAQYARAASGWQSDQGTAPYQQSFVTPVGTVLEEIRWWGFHGLDSGGSTFDNFVVQLDGVAQTGTLRVLPGASGFDEYILDVPDAALTASLLTIFNNDENVEWYWQSTTAVGNSNAPDGDGAVAFSLIGRDGDLPVSEPGTPALVLAACAGLVWSRRRNGAARELKAAEKAARCA